MTRSSTATHLLDGSTPLGARTARACMTYAQRGEPARTPVSTRPSQGRSGPTPCRHTPKSTAPKLSRRNDGGPCEQSPRPQRRRGRAPHGARRPPPAAVGGGRFARPRDRVGLSGERDDRAADCARAEEGGRNVSKNQACILLSGGLDSTAALCWATRARPEVRAIGFDYGQPHRDQELFAARSAAEALGVAYPTKEGA